MLLRLLKLACLMHNAHASPLGENVAEKHPTLWESYTQHFIQRIVYLLIQIFFGGGGGT